jgi:hypothetical protein
MLMIDGRMKALRKKPEPDLTLDTLANKCGVSANYDESPSNDRIRVIKTCQ